MPDWYKSELDKITKPTTENITYIIKNIPVNKMTNKQIQNMKEYFDTIEEIK
jgi:hypothetical protein